MPTNLPDVIVRYFERDTDRDIDSIVNLFADDAMVINEGEERRGTAAIRAWQTGAASKYTYKTEITSAEALGPDRYLVTGRLTGNFPGGTADLTATAPQPPTTAVLHRHGSRTTPAPKQRRLLHRPAGHPRPI